MQGKREKGWAFQMQKRDLRAKSTVSDYRAAITNKKGELIRLMERKDFLIDCEVVRKSAELDKLLVEYMKAK